MITVRRGQDRGHFDHGWLDTRHTFSFADYHDPAHMAFRSLRVINEDVVAAGEGFPPHPHRDMEIITYVLEGAVAHEDSSGGRGVIKPGEVQRMTAGRGVVHSEFNASKTERLHLLQIWLLPDKRGLTPEYEQKAFDEAGRRGRLRVVASRDARDGSVKINQDVSLYSAILAPGEGIAHTLAAGRHAWIQIARGAVKLNDQPLRAGDGAAVSDERELRIAATEPSELLLFDLA
jgi:hypothetical protein